MNEVNKSQRKLINKNKNLTFLYHSELKRIFIDRISTLILILIFTGFNIYFGIESCWVSFSLNCVAIIFLLGRFLKFNAIKHSVLDLYENKTDDYYYVGKTYKWATHRQVAAKFILLKYLSMCILYLITICIFYFGTSFVNSTEFLISIIGIDVILVLCWILYLAEKSLNLNSIVYSIEILGSLIVNYSKDAKNIEAISHENYKNITIYTICIISIIPIGYIIYQTIQKKRNYSNETIDTIEIDAIEA